MKIGIVGAGPAGLYLALILGKRLPGASIDVYEQNPRDATYGFGVGLNSSSWGRMRMADEASHDEIMRSAYFGRHQLLGHRGERILVERDGYGAGIGRLTLLGILKRHAEAAGARIHYDVRLEGLDRFADCDLVVGSDGSNSIVRRAHEAEFGTRSRTLTNRMAWYGSDRHYAPPFLIFKKTEFGYFWSVGYAHTELTSTFVAECDDEAWRRSGLGEMSHDEQVAFSTAMFAEELDGGNLITNNSIWRALTMVEVDNWSVGNRVLIGDALHSPHPTIGSGTRMAMDDAVTLAFSIIENPNDVDAALATFRKVREPAKAKLVEARDRSIAWYENVGEIADRLEPVPFVFDFMMRTGRIGLDRLRSEFPDFMERYGHLAPPDDAPSLALAG
ncbi:Salicyloyl-CoA 5-hydroxylase [Brevundimonas sp. NIBR10]|uniref:FAD-dependent monooxygenase n=1 Tax=Brevundimonas sp. NIBR10 TaxID=3015997 RepID=UPI0022F14B3D|nr:FAD-dependent monooxygenase [Brevundimonas sp. NIBR10]WGM45922.1 Salicyloyl-CoA 5-hydroxylase [Brevundimonas sp. NIBR10]